MQLHGRQIGPANDGYMNMEGAGPGAVVVWVSDPPQGGFPQGDGEYWFLPTGLPTSTFSAVQGSGTAPPYANHQGSWRSCENKPFGPPASTTYTITLTASDHIYQVGRFLNGVELPGATIRMWVRHTPSGPQMGWVAVGLPDDQRWLFPDDTTGTMALSFTPLSPGTYTFPEGARASVGPLTTA